MGPTSTSQRDEGVHKWNQGYNGNLLNSNSSWTEWHPGQIKFAQWYTGASELFSSMYVTINFYNGIYVKDSYVLGVFRI